MPEFAPSSSHVERLTVLSKSVHDAITEIFSMAYTHAQSHIPLPSHDSGPDVRLVEKILWINSILVPLASRQKTLALIQAFFRSSSLTLSKAEIASAVYGVQKDASPRYIDAQEINLTKLLSRTRTFLEESLAHTHQAQPLDWLVFDIKTRRYRLYKIRVEFGETH
jgi:hypothetical protein